MELPAPGLYRLKQDVANPYPDRRVKHSYDIGRIPVWKAGTVFKVMTPWDAPNSRDVYTRFAHMGIRISTGFMLGSAGVQWETMAPHLEKLPPTVFEILVEKRMENLYSVFLQRLVDSGKVKLEDVQAEIEAFLAEENDA